MKITKKWLKEKDACQSGVDWFLKQDKTDSIEVLKELIRQDILEDAGWLIVRVMNYKQYVSYAVFAAEQVIDIFENKHPDDKRPREAIEAAKACVDDPSDENKEIARKVAYAASDTAYYAAYYAAYAATAYASAAYASTVSTAANAAANDAANASANAYANANASTAYAKKEMRLKILNYGLELLKGSI